MEKTELFRFSSDFSAVVFQREICVQEVYWQVLKINTFGEVKEIQLCKGRKWAVGGNHNRGSANPMGSSGAEMLFRVGYWGEATYLALFSHWIQFNPSKNS